MVELLENEEPFWTPGEHTGYHMMTTGWLIGELIRRITGKSLGQYFKDEVSEPYSLDYWIGLPESEVDRVAKVTPFKPSSNDKPSGFATAFRTNPVSYTHLRAHETEADLVCRLLLEKATARVLSFHLVFFCSFV